MQNKQTLSKPLVVMLLASLCCLLWGSAIPFINLGYRYFGVTSSDTATQILFGGCRFFLAGLLTILFESVAQKKPALPKKTSWGNVVKLSLAQTIIQYVFFYIGVAHTASAKGAIIQGLQAFTSILIACFLFRSEKMNALKWLGGFIGVAGVVIVNWTKDGFGGGVSFIGEGFVIISMIASFEALRRADGSARKIRWPTLCCCIWRCSRRWPIPSGRCCCGRIRFRA